MFTPDRTPRPHYAKIFDELAAMAMGQFEERRQLADLSFLLQGITFTVYSDGRGAERLFPFDLVPRILPRSEWDHIERGLCQRVFALNLFLQDVYGAQRILKDRRIPRSLVYSCQHFRREMIGLQPPAGIYTHIAGIDLVRDSKTGDYLVLEDNVRTVEDFIQTDAPINPGNSGGALIDDEGRLVGINTAILSGKSGDNQGIGFAVPINMARHVMNPLVEHGKVQRAYLGILPQDVTPAIAKVFNAPDTKGALVGDITADGPASRTDLKKRG